MRSNPTHITAGELCHCLNVSKSSIYYEKQLSNKDLRLKARIIQVIDKHKTYGHKRIALELGINKKRVLRVLHKFSITPGLTRAKKPKYSYSKGINRFQNLIKGMCPIRPYGIWATDFTYLLFKNSFLYLATVIDIYTREIMGYCVSTRHTKDLVLEAVKHGLGNCPDIPMIVHSDEGSEYMSQVYINYLQINNIKISTSKLASPWENGYKEGFYSQFKLELQAKKLNRFNTLGEVVEHIYKTIYYYNNERIHLGIRSKPVLFREQELAKWSNVSCERLASKKMGT